MKAITSTKKNRKGNVLTNKVVTLTDVINEHCKDKEFAELFKRELVINEIAAMIVQARKHAHLTQKELAERAGTTQPVVARLERGSDDRMPSLELLTKLAFAAGTTLKISIGSGTK